MTEIHCSLVHYVITHGQDVQGECRPAVVVYEWDPGRVNLMVFLDGGDHHEGYGDNPYLPTSVRRKDHALEPLTFHTADTCPHRE